MLSVIIIPNLQDLCQEAPPPGPTPKQQQQQQQPLFSARISEVLAAVMEAEEDHEAHLAALHIMQDLLGKNRPAFDEQFVRLGLPNKIAALAGLLEEEGEEGAESAETIAESAETIAESAETITESAETVAESAETIAEGGGRGVMVDVPGGAKEEVDGGGGKPDDKDMSGPSDAAAADGAKKPEAKVFLEDATDVETNTPYQWHDWCLVRSRDCLYLWNEYCVIELSNVSNGWFRFLVDNRLATMYSSGSTEGGPDSYGEGVWL